MNPRLPPWLLGVALFGLVVPNGLFLHWLFVERPGVQAVLANHLAVAFMLDAMLVLLVLTVRFAVHPPGRLRWPWFVLLSLVGGLGFSLPVYLWLNRRGEGLPRPPAPPTPPDPPPPAA
ncbi:MAG: DUF2834 domain-containing protein [Gemmatimonadota bacterium]|jgi:hypothetical protein